MGLAFLKKGRASFQKRAGRPHRALSNGASDRVADLFAWVRNSGGFISDAVEYDRGESGSGARSTPGLRAARRVAPGEVLVTVPARCTLAVGSPSFSSPPLPFSSSSSTTEAKGGEEEAAAAACAAALRAACLEVPDPLWGLRLGLRLLAERARGADSPWQPYIATLPPTVGVPMFFSPQEVAALQYPPLVAQVGMRGKFLHGFCQRHLGSDGGGGGGAHLFHGRRADLGAVGWGFANATSRAFRLDRSSESGANPSDSSFVPVIGLCNHAFDSALDAAEGAVAGVGAEHSSNCRVAGHLDSNGGDHHHHHHHHGGGGGGPLVASALRSEAMGAQLVAGPEGVSAGGPLLVSYGDLDNDLLLLD